MMKSAGGCGFGKEQTIKMPREIRVSRSEDGNSVDYAIIGELAPYEAVEALCIVAVHIIRSYSTKHFNNEEIAEGIRFITLDCLEKMDNVCHE